MSTNTFLTTRQVQDLINVDRSTVYRMAEDGRLPGVKVGRQWRFAADRIAGQLGLATAHASDHLAASRAGPLPHRLGQLLLPEAAQSVADLLGDLFNTMAVVTDIEGRPITEVANPCGFFSAIADQPYATAACLEGWRRLAHEPELEPSFVPSHLGFLCARSFIRVDHQLVGMVIVGGVTPPRWPPSGEHLHQIARELAVSPALLNETIHLTWDLDNHQQQRILDLLPRVADLISQLASTRSQLLSKLNAIATLADPTNAQQRSTP